MINFINLLIEENARIRRNRIILVILIISTFLGLLFFARTKDNSKSSFVPVHTYACRDDSSSKSCTFFKNSAAYIHISKIISLQSSKIYSAETGELIEACDIVVEGTDPNPFIGYGDRCENLILLIKGDSK